MTVESILETAQYRVATKVAAEQGIEAKAIAPEILTLILEAVLLVIERCLAGRRAEEVAEHMRAPGLLEKLVVRHNVRRVIRETYGPFGFYRHGGAELTCALLEAGHEATDEERYELVRHVRQRVA